MTLKPDLQPGADPLGGPLPVGPNHHRAVRRQGLRQHDPRRGRLRRGRPARPVHLRDGAARRLPGAGGDRLNRRRAPGVHHAAGRQRLPARRARREAGPLAGPVRTHIEPRLPDSDQRTLQARAIAAAAIVCMQAANEEWVRRGGQADMFDLCDTAVHAIRRLTWDPPKPSHHTRRRGDLGQGRSRPAPLPRHSPGPADLKSAAQSHGHNHHAPYPHPYRPGDHRE